MASVWGTFFLRPGLPHPAKFVAEAVENVADGLAGGDYAAQFGDGQQCLADGLRGDAGVGEGGLELGVGLGVRLDQSADVFLQSRMQLLGGRAPAGRKVVEAADAGAEFVQTGVDGIASPAESGLGQPGGSAAVPMCHLGLKPSSLGPGKQRRRQQNGPSRVVHEIRHIASSRKFTL
jgi:hypothetical protein